jgi:hypothetical protein
MNDRSWAHSVSVASEKATPWITGSLCVVKDCPHPIGFCTAYVYVTGRAGRTTRARRFVCEAHARKFATKHRLEMPPPAAQPRPQLQPEA